MNRIKRIGLCFGISIFSTLMMFNPGSSIVHAEEENSTENCEDTTEIDASGLDYKNDLLRTISENDISPLETKELRRSYTSELVDDEDFIYKEFDYDYEFQDFIESLHIYDPDYYSDEDLHRIAEEYIDKGYKITDLTQYAETFNRYSGKMGYRNKYFSRGFQIAISNEDEDKFTANVAKISKNDFKNYKYEHLSGEGWTKDDDYHYSLVENKRYSLVTYNPDTGIMIEYVDKDAAEICNLISYKIEEKEKEIEIEKDK
ncbi:MAG: hypothetical protein IKS48_11895 [Eubacterium sp.]|nr:hypothetical protein [Eubacterium sp.]